MAGELTFSLFMKFNPGLVIAQQQSSGTITADVTGNEYTRMTQNIGTSAEAVVQGSVGTPGYILVHNLDTTNFVELGYDDTGFKPTVKVPASGWAFFYVSAAAATLQAKADTGACDIEYFLLEA